MEEWRIESPREKWNGVEAADLHGETRPISPSLEVAGNQKSATNVTHTMRVMLVWTEAWIGWWSEMSEGAGGCLGPTPAQSKQSNYLRSS